MLCPRLNHKQKVQTSQKKTHQINCHHKSRPKIIIQFLKLKTQKSPIKSSKKCSPKNQQKSFITKKVKDYSVVIHHIKNLNMELYNIKNFTTYAMVAGPGIYAKLQPNHYVMIWVHYTLLLQLQQK